MQKIVVASQLIAIDSRHHPKTFHYALDAGLGEYLVTEQEC